MDGDTVVLERVRTKSAPPLLTGIIQEKDLSVVRGNVGVTILNIHGTVI